MIRDGTCVRNKGKHYDRTLSFLTYTKQQESQLKMNFAKKYYKVFSRFSNRIMYSLVRAVPFKSVEGGGGGVGGTEGFLKGEGPNSELLSQVDYVYDF